MSENDPNAQQFAIQRLYLKDSSFESPAAPAIFGTNLRLEVKLGFDTSFELIDEAQGMYEVVLKVNLTARAGEQVAYIVELIQAGLFGVRGFDQQRQDYMLRAFCPSQMYPYAREAIDSLVAKGGFPPPVLPPMNFDAAYAQRKTQEQKASLN